MHRDIVACLQTTVVPEIEQMMASQANVIAAYKAAFISQHKLLLKRQTGKVFIYINYFME